MSSNSATNNEGIRSEMTTATTHHAALLRGVAAVPLLQPSSYPSWRPRMEAYLMRMGLEEAYKDELESWTELHAKMREWILPARLVRFPPLSAVIRRARRVGRVLC